LLLASPAARYVLELRQEFLLGGVRTSHEQAKAAAARAREARWVALLRLVKHALIFMLLMSSLA
jgi:hypothetical protein